jgi:hypothetical protein
MFRGAASPSGAGVERLSVESIDWSNPVLELSNAITTVPLDGPRCR